MPTNDFKAFATGAGANVTDQPTYTALQALSTGFQSGIAQSAQLNKVWRQSSIMSASLAQFIMNRTGRDVIDDGNLVSLENALIQSIQAVTKIKAAANINFYVNASSGNDANDGLTLNTAKKTIQAAVNVVYYNYDYNGFSPTINVANGTYNVVGYAANCTGLPTGAPNLNIIGNIASPSSVLINVTAGIDGNGWAFSAGNAAWLIVQGVSVSVSGAANGYCFIANLGGSLHVSNVICRNSTVAQLGAAVFGALGVIGPVTFSGTSPYGLLAGQAQLWAPSASFTFLGGTTYTSAFASSTTLGNVIINGGTFSGSFTGARYSVNLNSLITTNGGGANYFPGTSPGTVDSGGLYT